METHHSKKKLRGKTKMARPRKNPPKDAAPAAPAAAAPAANPFAPAAAPAAPVNPFAAPAQTFAGFPPSAPAANPAPAAFAAIQAAHPTQNPAAPAVDLGEVNAKLDAIAKTLAGFGNEFKALHSGQQTILGKLVEAAAAPVTSAPSAPSQPVAVPAAPAAPSAPATTQAGSAGFDPSQVAAMVSGIRAYAGQAYGNGAAPINAHAPNVATYLVQAAIQTGVPYLQGQDPSNPQVQEHVLSSLQQAGALDAQGNILA